MTGWYVSAADIRHWTETSKRVAEDTLPLLIKKLILASCKPQKYDFPSGDNVAVGGWDGILEVDTDSPFIPRGTSGWEFGTNSNVKGKADSDFSKRSTTPAPLEPASSTFVFVTSRLWTRKDNWVRSKLQLNRWKDVRGINAETLSEWLEQCPAVHRWFSGLIGKRSTKVKDTSQAWSDFTNATKVQITKEYILHGRDREIFRLIELTRGDSAALRIKSSSIIESYTFILSALQTDDSTLARSLVIYDQSSWDEIIQTKNKLILIPNNFSPTGIGTATKNGHIVLLPIDEKNTSDEDIHLTRLNRIERESALKLLGIPENEISGIYHSTKGYLEPLLRNPKLEPIDYSIPTWLSSYPEEVLLAALFATEWTENNKEDCRLLETLSGIPYQEFQKSVISLSRENDPPIRQIGDMWQVIAKVDFWLLISPLLSKPSLDRLEQAARDAICDLDPAFELPNNERYLASIKGKKPKYSGLVKLGISDSLALLSAYGDDRSRQLGGLKPSQVVKGYIKDIFKNNETPEFWYSLGRKMQPLAEAAPEEFLQAVEAAAQGDSNIIQSLFEESEDPLMSSCQHSELLWSIELISWNKELLSTASLILCRLCEIDPGGSWSNRPFNSLTAMYLGWVNNCIASHSERAQIIEMVLFREYPEIAWDLCISLLYSNTISSTGLSKPEYRDWSSNVEKSTLQRDYISYVHKLSNILIEKSESSQIENILDLIKNFDSFDEDQRRRVLEKLDDITADSISEENRKKLLDKIRDLVSRHREFPDSDWAWSDEILSPLSDTYLRLDFTEPEKSNLYLFTNGYPDLINPPVRKELDIKERDRLIRDMRIAAVSETYEKSGIEGIKYLAINCISPSILGRCAYESSVSEELLEHTLAWITDTENLGIFAREYIYSLANPELPQALEVYSKHEGSWDSARKSHFLRALPICEEVLKIVEGSPEDCKEIYWKNLYYFFTPNNPSLVQRVARKLSDYKRHLSAIDCVAMLFHRKTSADLIDAQLVYEILIKIATEETSSERISIQNVRHDILEAIKFVQDYGNDTVLDICYLEWTYLKLFRFENVTPNFLIAKISEEPDFFAQLVSWIFNNSAGEIDNQDGLSEEAHRQRAELAWELLDTADNLPGQKGDTVDTDQLLTWVTQARATLNKLDRLGIGDDRIGSYLSRGPIGSDGVWPHEAVRNVIEKIKSSDLDEAIGIGRLNTRGVTWRHPYAGGEQERKLAEKYQADAVKLQLIYPRSARILFDLAKHYESDATRQDQEVQINE